MFKIPSLGFNSFNLSFLLFQKFNYLKFYLFYQQKNNIYAVLFFEFSPDFVDLRESLFGLSNVGSLKSDSLSMKSIFFVFKLNGFFITPL